jgi:putative hydrolase of the HAD superfamily
VDLTFHGLIKELPSKTFFPELYEQFARAGSWKIFPDVLPALETLAAADLKLAIISNWDDRLRPLLQALNLARYFEPIIISCEVGCQKPSRQIFQATAERLGVTTSEILHVGDDPANDLEGARQAGFQARLLKRDSITSGPEEILCLSKLYSEE